MSRYGANGWRYWKLIEMKMVAYGRRIFTLLLGGCNRGVEAVIRKFGGLAHQALNDPKAIGVPDAGVTTISNGTMRRKTFALATVHR
jgi:hypothetical protein